MFFVYLFETELSGIDLEKFGRKSMAKLNLDRNMYSLDWTQKLVHVSWASP